MGGDRDGGVFCVLMEGLGDRRYRQDVHLMFHDVDVLLVDV